MDNLGFEVTQWDHWLLVVAFVGIAGSGLWLSWQWRRDQQRQREQIRLSQQLALSLYHHSQSGSCYAPGSVKQRESRLSAHDLSQHVLSQTQAAQHRSVHRSARSPALRNTAPQNVARLDTRSQLALGLSEQRIRGKRRFLTRIK